MISNKKRNGVNLLPTRSKRAVTMNRTARYKSENNATQQKFVIGLDYGTTFTSVSYFFHPASERHPRAFPEQLLSIKNWPSDLSSGDANASRPQVPTETVSL